MKKAALLGLFFSLSLPLISGCGKTGSSLDISNENGSAFYEIFVGSFYDSNGDGMGDLNGVTAKLDYLTDLGISGIWFMPIMPSPSYHKYDVTNYEDIDSAYGTLADFSTYIAAAQAHHIKTLIDLVVNHTSSAHPWFVEGANQYRAGNCPTDDMSQKCHYYNFSHTYQSGYNQLGTTNVFYESRFQSGMPDLNLDNPYVRTEIAAIIAFWLNLGADGFRLDAVTSYYTDQVTKNIEFMNWLNTTTKAIKPAAYIVAEGPWSTPNSATNIQTYYQSGIDSVFNFTLAQTGGKIVSTMNNATGQTLAQYITDYNTVIHNYNQDALDAPFLSNHDLGRSAGYYYGDNSDYKIKTAGSLYLMMPGHPFIYYGEEIGMRGSGVDPNKRLPMVWSSTDNTGACNLPLGANYDMSAQVSEGVEDQLLIADSQLNHYRTLVHLRNAFNDYIEQGTMTPLSLDTRLFALQYARLDGKIIWVVINTSPDAVSVAYTGDMRINQMIATNGTASTMKTSFFGKAQSLEMAGYGVAILTPKAA